MRLGKRKLAVVKSLDGDPDALKEWAESEGLSPKALESVLGSLQSQTDLELRLETLDRLVDAARRFPPLALIQGLLVLTVARLAHGIESGSTEIRIQELAKLFQSLPLDQILGGRGSIPKNTDQEPKAMRDLIENLYGIRSNQGTEVN